MSGSTYVPADIIDEARDLRRQGYSLESLAIRIGIDAEDLAKLLGEPVWRQIPDDLRAVAAVRSLN